MENFVQIGARVDAPTVQKVADAISMVIHSVNADATKLAALDVLKTVVTPPPINNVSIQNCSFDLATYPADPEAA